MNLDHLKIFDQGVKNCNIRLKKFMKLYLTIVVLFIIVVFPQPIQSIPQYHPIGVIFNNSSRVEWTFGVDDFAYDEHFAFDNYLMQNISHRISYLLTSNGHLYFTRVSNVYRGFLSYHGLNESELIPAYLANFSTPTQLVSGWGFSTELLGLKSFDYRISNGTDFISYSVSCIIEEPTLLFTSLTSVFLSLSTFSKLDLPAMGVELVNINEFNYLLTSNPNTGNVVGTIYLNAASHGLQTTSERSSFFIFTTLKRETIARIVFKHDLSSYFPEDRLYQFYWKLIFPESLKIEKLEGLVNLPSGSQISQGNKATIDFNLNDSVTFAPFYKGMVINLIPRTKDAVELLQENYLEWAVTALIALGSLPFVTKRLRSLWKRIRK